MKLDEDLASIHAYLCADGYVVKNPPTQKHKYYRIGFRNTNLILLKDFQEKFEKVFGIKPRLVEHERCEKGSREIYERLSKEFGSFYSWHWKMPSLKRGLYKNWLRSYFDCESWVTCKSHQNRHIGLDCVNEAGLNQVISCLNKLGIKSIKKYNKKRKIYRIFIYGKENLIEFNKKIGFLHPDKKEKLNKAIKDFINYFWVFPKEDSELIKYLRELLNLRAKVNPSNKNVRIISNKEENLIRISKELNRLFNIECKPHKRINGIGTIYYELNINKQGNIITLINNNLLNELEREKWLKLKR